MFRRIKDLSNINFGTILFGKLFSLKKALELSELIIILERLYLLMFILMSSTRLDILTIHTWLL